MRSSFFLKKLLILIPVLFLAAMAALSTYDFFTDEPKAFNKPSSRLIDIYMHQAPARRLYMSEATEERGGWGRIYNNLAPEVYCSELVKVGTTDDGGKWMCSPFNLPNDCTIFSLGMNNEITFEQSIQQMTKKRCQLYGFDSERQAMQIRNRLRLINAQAVEVKITRVTNKTLGEYTISDLMQKHNVGDIEILKMDIEGAEFQVLYNFLEENTVGQLLIEIHGKPHETLRLLKMIAKHGYHLFHYEINGIYHQLCEYSFLHESVFDRYQATPLARFLI